MARASKFAVSKVSTGSGGGETRGSSKRHGLGYTFVKCSSLAVAKTLILLGDDGAAPIDHAGAGRVDGASRGVTLHSRWRRPRRCRCGFVPGRASRKCPAPTPWHAWTAGAAALRAGRRRAPLYAIDATRHEFRQQAELRRAAPRSPSPTRPLRLHVRILQPRPVVRRSERFRGRTRTHACFGWGSRGPRHRLVHASFSLIRQRSVI